VNRVVPVERLMETARKLADTLKAKPREAIAIGKALFHRQLEQGFAAAYSDASRTIALNMSGDVAKEGVDAFLVKFRRAGSPEPSRAA
jgi:enoyl-CoA hydratase/carnithine racemase